MGAQKAVFVGLGPNQTCWKRALEHGDAAHARKVAARLAVTGRLGEKLAKLLGISTHATYRGFARRNLNASWNGKNGKGDKFDREEGALTAKKILEEDFTHHVLLGAEAARSFGFQGMPTLLVEYNGNGKHFLLFPHPSGINAFWNKRSNVALAGKRLREFLGMEKT